MTTSLSRGRTDRTAPFPALRPPPRWARPLAVVILLAGMAFAMVTAAVQQTPTIDEPVYVGTATAYLHQHEVRYNPEHPPLAKLIIATGLAFDRPTLDPGFAGDQSALGRRVLYESGNDPWRVMLLARLPMIVLTLLFGLVVYGFARDVTGPVGGLLALTLYALSPDVIAHGSLAGLDVPVAGFLLVAAWSLWRARRRPVRYLPLAGLALGAALATKMTALAVTPVLLLLAVLSVWSATRPGPDGTAPAAAPERPGTATVTDGPGAGPTDGGSGRPGDAGRRLALGVGAAAGVALLAVGVVWLSYLAVDPRLRWTPPAGLPTVDGLRALLVDRLPFPPSYRDGMRVQFGFEDTTWGGFLFGQQYLGSRWYYLPVALLVKTPLGALALWLVGAVALVALPGCGPRRRTC
ncbi:hypothetical protein GCM10027605_22720 [Micromonospora zhanjiangensis]